MYECIHLLREFSRCLLWAQDEFLLLSCVEENASSSSGVSLGKAKVLLHFVPLK